ncbi:hypothetical protein chiPu_0032521, partial [Chiloscyllium punctatum]|nr:hypothetical protein [Chiloscyllium punctatum]
MLLHNRYASMMAHIFPFSLVAWYYESVLNARFRHSNYGLQANH